MESNNNPLASFAIEKLLGIDAPILGLSVYLTNNSFYLLISVSVALMLLVQSNSILGQKLVPSNLGIIGESIHASVLNLARGTASNQSMYPFLLALFTIILGANLISNIPYNYASTSALTFSLGLSFTIFIGVTVFAISIKHWSYLATFVPSGTPGVLLPVLVLIELASYSARAISLGVRLFANIVSGHTLLNIVSTMANKIATSGWLGLVIVIIPLGLLVGLVGLEIAVAFIQAYVFVVLTGIYNNEAMKPL